MSSVTRLEDLGSGHDACPVRKLIEASEDVFINGRGVGRVGDTYHEHGCDIHAPHTGAIARGSSSVFVNGKPVGRVGDPITCGGSVLEGSPDCFIG